MGNPTFYGGLGDSILGTDTSMRMPPQISTQEKTLIVDPRVHAWGAYENGELQRSGLATAGGDWCPDVNRPCRTKVGTFRIHSLGASDCKSSKYPLPRGGAPMPYCMFFNGNQGLHGSGEVVDANVSHGCVRLHVADAEWIRFNFANIGTKVVVKPY
jgi:lipoprotein-anchoring transpeptidase ErfK/SrfK